MTEQKINSFLEQVNPPITVKKHYSFEWIPVKKNPVNNESRDYRPGCFVLMVRITPTEPWNTYHYILKEKSFSYIKRDKTEPLSGHELNNLIR